MKSIDDYAKLLSRKARWNFKDRQKKWVALAGPSGGAWGAGAARRNGSQEQSGLEQEPLPSRAGLHERWAVHMTGHGVVLGSAAKDTVL